jgi:hypothetical protein
MLPFVRRVDRASADGFSSHGGTGEERLRGVIDPSRTALDELSARLQRKSDMPVLAQMANKLVIGYESLVAAVREVFDDRFWKDLP